MKFLRQFNLKRSLFARVFFTFWLIGIFIIFTVGTIGRNFFTDPMISPLAPEQLANLNAITYQMKKSVSARMDAGKTLSRAFMDFQMGQQLPAILISENERFLYAVVPLPKRPDEEYMLFLATYEYPVQTQIFSSYLFGPIDVVIQDEAFKFFLLQPRPMAWLFDDYTYPRYAIVSLAFVISGCLCFMLAWSLTRPLKALQRQANALIAQPQDYGKDFTWEVAPLATEDVKQLAVQLNIYHNKIQDFVHRNEQLLADIAHEIRTPLTRQKLALDALANDALANNKPQHQNIEKILRENHRMAHLLSTLLRYSKMQNLEHFQRQTHSVHDLLLPLVDDIALDCDNAQKSLSVDIKQDCEIYCDEYLFISAIENVARNAVKYSTSRVSFSQTVASKNNQGYLVVTITDDGPGVDDEDIDRIFDPFFRVEKSRNRELGGVGLGLSIAKRSIEVHNGNIFAKNTSPHGLVVSIQLGLS